MAFRADASLQIGTGHVMRCLTLADALAAAGADCQFICRVHEGNLIEFIRGKGFVAHALPITGGALTDREASAANHVHAQWLGATQAQDAEACASILAAHRVDWLICDHYALDARWEGALAPYYRRLMVIDDLADRSHACDLLLDQTVGRDAADYNPLVPAGCNLLCGSKYALLRPEFAALRSYSLQRRAQPALRELLITMGGIDKDNATSQILQALRNCYLPKDCRITVVIGPTAPWLEDIRAKARDMPWPTKVLVGVSNMARLMAETDLAIGAAGTTSWERCCLGLPAIIVVLGDNQFMIAHELARAGAVQLIEHRQRISEHLPKLFVQMGTGFHELALMSEAASAIVDGNGVNMLIRHLDA